MENASKALIIAGAILLKFTQYEGDNVRGSNVNALINTIIQNNLTNSNDASKQISIKIHSGASWNGTKYDGVETEKEGTAYTGRSYKVGFVADGKSGYVKICYIAGADIASDAWGSFAVSE